MASSTTLPFIPNEIWDKIFSKIPGSLLALLMTCKQFHRVVMALICHLAHIHAQESKAYTDKYQGVQLPLDYGILYGTEYFSPKKDWITHQILPFLPVENVTLELVRLWRFKENYYINYSARLPRVMYVTEQHIGRLSTKDQDEIKEIVLDEIKKWRTYPVHDTPTASLVRRILTSPLFQNINVWERVGQFMEQTKRILLPSAIRSDNPERFAEILSLLKIKQFISHYVNVYSYLDISEVLITLFHIRTSPYFSKSDDKPPKIRRGSEIQKYLTETYDILPGSFPK